MFRFPGFDSQDDFNVYSFSDSELSEDQEDDDEDSIDSVDLQDIEDSLLNVLIYSTYFAHTLQPVIKDGLKEAKSFSKILTKVSNIIF